MTEKKTRAATQADAQNICDLLNGSYRGEGAKVGWTTESDLVDGMRTSKEEVLQLLEQEGSHFILVEDESLQACVHVKVEDLKTLYFGMLAVRPTLQGRGLGALLLSEVEAFAKRNSLKEIRLSVIHLRAELISYYERKGFRPTGLTEEFPLPHLTKVPDIRLLEMRKIL
jgi:GNAT superfamily N-acetyltransferase